MKKSIFALLAILVMAGNAYATQGPDGNPAAKRETGAPGYFPYREYQLARYSASGPNDSSLTKGDVVIKDCVSDDGVSVGLVGVVGSSDAVMGVVVSTVIQTTDISGVDITASQDYGRRNWGWVQVRGFNDYINMVGSNPTVGGAIKASDSARNADRATGLTNGSLQGRVMGFAYDASTSSEVEIQL